MAADAFQRVMALLPLIGGLLGSILLLTGVLRTLLIGRRVDELTARHWRRLAQIQSTGGSAFFPTRDARVELEVAIAQSVELADSPERRRRFKRRGRSRSVAA
jgi:hypothetical protein